MADGTTRFRSLKSSRTRKPASRSRALTIKARENPYREQGVAKYHNWFDSKDAIIDYVLERAEKSRNRAETNFEEAEERLAKLKALYPERAAL